MDRIGLIINNSEYMRCIKYIEDKEINRVYCRHGFSHGLDVARIAYIINLESSSNLEKDVIYAAALLHDIGRANEYRSNEEHHGAGERMAKTILEQCSYTDDEIELISSAIRNHKYIEEDDGSLDYILYKADKLSRNCFLCEARNECYWSENVKNHTVTI